MMGIYFALETPSTDLEIFSGANLGAHQIHRDQFLFEPNDSLDAAPRLI